jgi:hypothetical protein
VLGIRRAMGAVLLATTLVGCGGGGGDDAPQASDIRRARDADDLQDALALVKDIVNDTTNELAPDAPRRPQTRSEERDDCLDSLDNTTGEKRTQFGYVITLPDDMSSRDVLEQGARFWRSRGLPVEDHELERPAADGQAIYMGFEDYNFELLAGKRFATVGGSTACYRS